MLSEMVGDVGSCIDSQPRQAVGDDALVVDFWTILPHILCDYCKKPLEINLRCSMCKCAYYCSKNCSLNDWKKEHKSMCKLFLSYIDDINQKNARSSTILPMKIIRLNNARLHEEECCICLEKMTDPIILNCDHLFCLKCLFEHYTNANKSCPLCRSNILNGERMIHHYIYKTAVEFLILAQGKPFGSEERLILCQAATTHLTYIQRLKNYYMESLCVAFTDKYDDSSEPRPIEVTEALNSLGAQFAQVEFVAGVILVQILFCEGNFKDCADKAEVRLNEYFSTISKTLNDSDTNFIETLITKLIEALIELKQYERAKKYVLLFGTMLGSDIRSESLKARAFRKLYEQYSIVLHGLGSYNESINYCNMAIEANRHYHNAYDCLMKNYEAKGEMDKVLLVLNKAIKYEVPWDDAVTEKHRETLKMLQRQNK